MASIVGFILFIWVVGTIAEKIGGWRRRRQAAKAVQSQEFKDERALRERAEHKLAEVSEKLQAEKERCAALESELRAANGERNITAVENRRLQQELTRHKANLSRLLESNLTSMPWLAGMMADFITYDLEVEAQKLDWGSNIRREQKVASIREIRAEAEAKIKEAREAYYELEYLRSLFPSIDDIIETDYRELQVGTEIPDSDPARRYLSKAEWDKLSDAERDQLALDRYVESRKKSRWQIGRDYELAVAYEYMQKGYVVDTFGSYMQLEDLGRDLIAKQNGMTLIIQCKYWSSSKTVHEKHIFQLYGTIVSYCIEHGLIPESVRGLFVTSASLSETAKKAAELLNITVAENHKMVDFPRIKCNIGRAPDGSTAKIYHLPMDLQYDQTRIDKPGEFYAFTVAEAQAQGFRRAYRWHGSAGTE